MTMNKAIILTAIFVLCGCGGSMRNGEAPKTQTETKAVITDPGTSNTSSGLSNTSPDGRRGRGDTDADKTSDQVGRSSYRDDLRPGTKPANANLTATRHDADDRNKPDSDDND